MSPRHLIVSLAVLFSVIHLGALGYYYLLDGEYAYARCLYRTTVLISTVNEPFNFETMGLDEDQRITIKNYTLLLLVVGIGVFIYTVSALAAFLIEADLHRNVWRRKQRKRLKELKDHIIVCGGGETGQIILGELLRQEEPSVVIDNDPTRIESLRKSRVKSVVYLGDATDDAVLEEVGIARARGVITALPHDRDNLFVVVTARQLNPHVMIVTRSEEPKSDRKLVQAGANFVIASSMISAHRMVAAILRPTIVTFVDQILRDPDSLDRIEEVRIGERSEFLGRSLDDVRIPAEYDLLAIGVRQPGEHRFRLRPRAHEQLEVGTTLVVLGPVDRCGVFLKAADDPRADFFSKELEAGSTETP